MHGDNNLVGQAWLRAVTVGDLAVVKALAEADNHMLVAPTHVFEKILRDGTKEIVGYASVANVPLLLPWFSTKRCRARDSVYFVNAMENLVANLMPPNSPGLICVPVVKNSPFEKNIERLGYTPVAETVLTLKKVI